MKRLIQIGALLLALVAPASVVRRVLHREIAPRAYLAMDAAEDVVVRHGVASGSMLGVAEADAQTADYNTPITRNAIAKIKIKFFAFDADAGTVGITVKYLDSGNVELLNTGLSTKFAIPSSAGQPCTSATTLVGLAGAMNAARSGETGNAGRIQLFRTTGYLFDQGCFTGGTITLTP